MIELRWYDTGEHKVLQYRQKIDSPIRAGMWDPIEAANTAQFVWSEWIDVPTVESPMVNEITANDVAHLRTVTNASMMECKKALTACRGDMAKAIEWVRTHKGFYVYNPY